ncbi:hypothetical protein SI65_02380 [Aspergillus cristatus]|uniref:Uncharacterized protein n=1 Tax=Aspergillus cristatus TaxID=573508 RepID=A0A1E3BMB5_ASPCR|nr:hypothetical protein SI65_02380 [Aspergillus cristatus]
MATRVRYKVMDDYEHTVDLEDPFMPAFLNGDTAVRWTLQDRYAVPTYARERPFAQPDIEEDWHLNLENADIPEESMDLSYDEAKLLYTPLPPDLPTMKNELLIRMAAYEGNIDRYARLMRPRMSWDELGCVLRGIYHHTMFARWWADQLEINSQRLNSLSRQETWWRIKMAINARRVMTNDITGFNDQMEHKPWMIWWPLKPSHSTLRELARICPSMGQQIAIASILSDDQSTYMGLNAKPTYYMWLAAEQSTNAFYCADLVKRGAQMGIDPTNGRWNWDGEADATIANREPTSEFVYAPLHEEMMYQHEFHPIMYEGLNPDASPVHPYVWLTREWARMIEVDCGGVYTEGNLGYLLEESSDEERQFEIYYFVQYPLSLHFRFNINVVKPA